MWWSILSGSLGGSGRHSPRRAPSSCTSTDPERACTKSELLDVAAPFFAFRCLVLASPVWYPRLDESVRRTILRFAINVLDAPWFDPEKVEEYCAA